MQHEAGKLLSWSGDLTDIPYTVIWRGRSGVVLLLARNIPASRLVPLRVRLVKRDVMPACRLPRPALRRQAVQLNVEKKACSSWDGSCAAVLDIELPISGMNWLWAPDLRRTVQRALQCSTSQGRVFQ